MQLVIYEDGNFKGESKRLDHGSPWIGTDWNDRISSVVSNYGEWRLYEESNYRGRSELVCSGQRINLVKFDDQCSSIKSTENECGKYLIQTHPFRLKRFSNHP